MKIQGIDLTSLRVCTVVIPRPDGDVVVRAQSVRDYTEFDALCPRPLPNIKIKPGGIQEPDLKDPKFATKLNTWATQRKDWMMIKSLSATEDLVWDNVVENDPKTWATHDDELKAVFSGVEYMKIIDIVLDACGLNEEKIEEATKSFLSGARSAKTGQFSPAEEALAILSGDGVSVLG